MRLHLVFHWTLLEPYALNSISDHIVPPIPLVELVNDPEGFHKAYGEGGYLEFMQIFNLRMLMYIVV